MTDTTARAPARPWRQRIDLPVVTAFGCIVILLAIGSLYSPNFLSPEYLLQQLKVGAFLGVIATGIDEKLVDLRKGRSRVLETDHTLILGWSESVFTIVSELSIANESRRRPAVVILAEQDKVEMEDAIRSKVADLRGTRVVCRTGSPIDLDDLEIVNHQTARSVIVRSESFCADC